MIQNEALAQFFSKIEESKFFSWCFPVLRYVTYIIGRTISSIYEQF